MISIFYYATMEMSSDVLIAKINILTHIVLLHDAHEFHNITPTTVLYSLEQTMNKSMDSENKQLFRT